MAIIIHTPQRWTVTLIKRKVSHPHRTKVVRVHTCESECVADMWVAHYATQVRCGNGRYRVEKEALP